MCNTVKLSSLILIFFLTYKYDCLKIIPERASVVYVNETYFTDVSIHVRRISRRGDYIVNLNLTSHFTIGNNVSMDLVFYEYLHNEFRRSFVEFHTKVCDLILTDRYFGSIIRRAGLVKCPVPPGKISFKNAVMDMDIPSVWPFEKGNVEITITDLSTGTIMSKGEIVLTFKQKP